MGKIGIFGFGRIGRQLLRVALQDKLFVPVSISDIKDVGTLAALFEVDTNYKRWHEEVSGQGGAMTIGGREIKFIDSTKEVPDWKALDVDLVIDCTGRAVTRSVAQAHLDRGANRVLVSGPSNQVEDCDAVLLKGINLDSFDPDKHKIISMASCTTNALAPVVKLVRENYGIKYGLFSTVHSYTNTQSLTDQPMKNVRDSWAAAENIIPSSSGAAKALKFIWNDLQITGKAYRIPTRTGSIAELNLITEKPCSVDEINDMFRGAAKEGELKGVLDVLEGQWASSRIVGDSHSSIIDLPLTQVQGEIVSIAAWYDNEWGYASRLAEVAAFLANR
ncbi:type I glyceraldehyde-3-phosphate dehydrogenase [Cohnella lupini]|uniref:Glyceraldehyde 3-phosphate dehydrogenase n=1 Tax=Cohnella lupini TaxID=1294267 RepID=A0A3D9ISM7_9BACL|nr:type I glyceraldehyde-3-phosphate dehydrogenase [Cohnella lupini]RED64791.1 glyceraldehyde 3-phosphate dehydrogenase [Cohnella lupini]